MVSVATALSMIGNHTRTCEAEQVGLSAAAGRVLAVDVFADRDFPPFNRVMMDGIAIRCQSFEEGQRSFTIESILAAGRPHIALQDSSACIEVMTGAMLPGNTDVVIPYEDCTREDGVVRINIATIRKFQNVHLAGTDSQMGDLLIERYSIITPAAIGVLASVGMHQVEVLALPRIAICATGDELVAVDKVPLPHQIRQSNSFMLAAALRAEGIDTDLYHLTDEEGLMEVELSSLLGRYDVLLFSGAVSKGKYDFLPEVLNRLGMQTVFHRIAQRPGKPFLFGTFDNGPVIFGFPGNPASTLVCYAIYFLPWLRQCLKQPLPLLQAQLAAPLSFSPQLSYHLLVKLQIVDGVLRAEPCPAANSGDLVGLQRADAIITLPAERSEFAANELFPLTPLASPF